MFQFMIVVTVVHNVKNQLPLWYRIVIPMLDELEARPGPRVEWLIIDNASTDGTAPQLEAMSFCDQRIQTLHLANQVSVEAALQLFVRGGFLERKKRLRGGDSC